MEPTKNAITVIIDDDDEEEGSSIMVEHSTVDSEEDNDIVDRIHAHEWLNSDDILLGIAVLTTFIFDASNWVTVIDPGMLATYADSKRKIAYPDSAIAMERRRDTLTRKFEVMAPREKLIVIPIYENDHWSVLFYMNLRRRFYFTDSMGEYHQNRISRIITDFLDDQFMEEKGTTITFVKSRPQKHAYECGQYLFMFIYAFVKNILIAQRDHPPPSSHDFPIIKPLVSDIDLFDQTLTAFIYNNCCEETRPTFIGGFIQKIHAFHPVWERKKRNLPFFFLFCAQ